MKKNPGRKMRRQQLRDLKKENSKIKVYSAKENPREPYPNAIKANEERDNRIEQINKQWEEFKGFFNKDTAFSKEMLKQQKARQKRREKWKKELGLN